MTASRRNGATLLVCVWRVPAGGRGRDRVETERRDLCVCVCACVCVYARSDTPPARPPALTRARARGNAVQVLQGGPEAVTREMVARGLSRVVAQAIIDH